MHNISLSRKKEVFFMQMVKWFGGVMLAFLLLPGSAGALEFKAEPIKTKLQEKDLIFAVTFDQRHTNADKYTGAGENIYHPEIDLGLRGELGFDNQQAFYAGEKEELIFPLKKNLLPEEGTFSMWACAKNFDPSSKTLKKNISLFKTVLQSGRNGMENFVYVYNGKIYFTWRYFSGGEKNKGASVISCDFTVPQNQWFQLVWTWNKDEFRLYLDGKLIGKHNTPELFKSFYGKKIGGGSFIGVNSSIWDMSRQAIVSIDDIKVFSRAMSSAMVANRYHALLKNAPKREIKYCEVNFEAVEKGVGKLPAMAITVDASGVPGSKYPEKINYVLQSTAKYNKKGSIALKNGIGRIEVEIPADGAVYTFTTAVGGKKESASVEIPDLNFIFTPQRPDVIPSPWTPMEADKNAANVKVWNREYIFGNAPFPQQVLVNGRKLLEKGVEIKADGKAVANWQLESVKRGKSWIERRGSGKGNGFTVKYVSRIEFDGMVKVDFSIHGKPELKSLAMDWQLAKDFRKFIMTPRVQENVSKVEFGYPRDQAFHSNFMLWMLSTEAGFFWMPEHDGNWVNAENANTMSADLTSGKCSVSLISGKVTVPEGAFYSSYCSATPTRPAPDSVRLHVENIALEGWGEKYVISYEVDPEHDEMMLKNYTGKLRDRTMIPYNMGHGLSSSNPTAVFFNRAWDIPNMRVYNEGHLIPLYDKGYYKFGRIPSTNCCPCNTNFANYVIHYQSKLIKHKLGKKFGGFYFDLANVNLCNNRLHGCGFTDKFNRDIKVMTIAGMRDLFIRSLLVCREAGVPLILHAQQTFTPVVNGIGDYWYPGEHLASWVRRNNFTYTDVLSDNFYMTECNRYVLGCGVIFLPQVMSARKGVYVPQFTEAMLSKLLLHDIGCNFATSYRPAFYRVRDIFDRYGVYSKDCKVHLYYRQNEVDSGNKNVLITYFTLPDGNYMLVLSNKTAAAQKCVVDLSKLNPAGAFVRDEYRNTEYPLHNQKFAIEVPGRNFALVAVNPVNWLPYKDGFDRPWPRYMNGIAAFGNWLRANLPEHDQNISRNAPPAMAVQKFYPVIHDGSFMLTKPNGVKDSYVKFLPVKAQRNYEFELFAKTVDQPGDSQIKLSVTPVDAKYKPCGGAVTVPLKELNSANWVKLAGKVNCDSANTRWLKFEIHVPSMLKGAILFDDLTVVEK